METILHLKIHVSNKKVSTDSRELSLEDTEATDIRLINLDISQRRGSEMQKAMNFLRAQAIKKQVTCNELSTSSIVSRNWPDLQIKYTRTFVVSCDMKEIKFFYDCFDPLCMMGMNETLV